METLTRIKIDPVKLREKRGNRTLAEVAESVGVSKQAICNYEHHSRRWSPSSDVLVRLCLLYECAVTDVASPQ